MNTIEMDVAQAARWFHALSDETRVRVVDLLSSGEKCVCDLQEAMGAAQSRLSFHLKVLREAGLVSDRKQGRWNYYSLRGDVLGEMAEYLKAREPDEDATGVCGCGSGSSEPCCG